MIRSHALFAWAPALLLLAGACTTLPAPAAPVAPAAPATATTTLTAPDGRSVPLTIITPATPRGVILFSHGGGNSPQSTAALFARLTAKGFAVLAPMHTDSQDMPTGKRTDILGAFGTRIADMKVVAAHARTAFPDLPMAQVGYSYGTLISVIGAGALAKMVPGSNPGVKAVVMLSSPGPVIPVITMPGAFDGVTAPTLLVTGDADVVPGFVPDPAKHLVYFEQMPASGDHTALVVAGATHRFPGGKEPGWDEVIPLVEDFLTSRVLDDKAAKARFDDAASTARVTIKRR